MENDEKTLQENFQLLKVVIDKRIPGLNEKSTNSCLSKRKSLRDFNYCRSGIYVSKALELRINPEKFAKIKELRKKVSVGKLFFLPLVFIVMTLLCFIVMKMHGLVFVDKKIAGSAFLLFGITTFFIPIVIICFKLLN